MIKDTGNKGIYAVALHEGGPVALARWGLDEYLGPRGGWYQGRAPGGGRPGAAGQMGFG